MTSDNTTDDTSGPSRLLSHIEGMKVIFMFFSTCYFEIINGVGVVLFLQTSFAVCAFGS